MDIHKITSPVFAPKEFRMVQLDKGQTLEKFLAGRSEKECWVYKDYIYFKEEE